MSTVLKWGLITGMVYVAFSLGNSLLGIQPGGGGGANMGLGFLMNFLLMVVSFFTIFMGIKEIRDQDKNGFLTFGEGFMGGLKIALIASVVAGIFSMIYWKFIDPDLPDKILSAAEEQWDEANAPEEGREMGRKMIGFMTNPLLIIPITILWIAFWGVVKSLVASAILKKDPPYQPSPTIPVTPVDPTPPVTPGEPNQ